eukprot:gene5165-7015_t
MAEIILFQLKYDQNLTENQGIGYRLSTIYLSPP